MTVKNLWKLPEDVSSVRTPTVILSEQAPFLAEMTNELIRARVSRRISPRNNVSLTLRIEAPALGSYSFQVLNLQHDFLSSFPCHVRSSINETSESVESEFGLLEVLKRILESEEMQSVLSSLLRESQMQSSEDDLPF